MPRASERAARRPPLHASGEGAARGTTQRATPSGHAPAARPLHRHAGGGGGQADAAAPSANAQGGGGRWQSTAVGKGDGTEQQPPPMGARLERAAARPPVIPPPHGRSWSRGEGGRRPPHLCAPLWLAVERREGAARLPRRSGGVKWHPTAERRHGNTSPRPLQSRGWWPLGFLAGRVGEREGESAADDEALSSRRGSATNGEGAP